MSVSLEEFSKLKISEEKKKDDIDIVFDSDEDSDDEDKKKEFDIVFVNSSDEEDESSDEEESDDEFEEPNEFGIKMIKGFTLFDHQIDAVKWMQEREENPRLGVAGGLLALIMGLGKTNCSSTLCMTETHDPGSYIDGAFTGLGSKIVSDYADRHIFPNLVICSKTVAYEWKRDIKKFYGNSCPFLYFHRSAMKKTFDLLTYDDIKDYKIIITTYETIMNVAKKHKLADRQFILDQFHRRAGIENAKKPSSSVTNSAKGGLILFKTPWHRIIADESHRFANPKTSTFHAMMCLYGDKKWCLSGTPLRNYCFPGNTRVITDKGNIKIKDIMSNDSFPNILSFNQEKGIFEYKKLLTKWILKPESSLITIVMGKKKISCTSDHRILTLNGYVEAKYLKLGDQIIYYDDTKRGCNLNILNKDQEQIAIGSYLGDGHFRVGEYNRVSLHVGHCEKQKNYCEWKANIFGCKIKIGKNNGFGYDSLVYKFDTTSFYFTIPVIENKNSVPKELIDKIDNLALAIWYMDDGYFINGHGIELATHSFDLESQEMLCEKLRSFNIECDIRQKKQKGTVYNFIYINAKGTRELIKRVYPYIHEDLKYKVLCNLITQQIEDDNKELTDVFWEKENIPIKSRKIGQIIKQYTLYKGKQCIGLFKWDVCKKCNIVSFLNKRNDGNSYKCNNCRKNTTSLKKHLRFEFVSREIHVINNKFYEYKLHPVTQIYTCNKNYDYVYDIEVEDNHNFIIGSLDDNIRYGPVVHNCSDLYSQFRFCGYDQCMLPKQFNYNTYDRSKMYEFILCKDYKDTGIKLPDIKENNIEIVLKDREKEIYDYYHGATKAVYNGFLIGSYNFSNVLTLFLRLRQICVSPYTILAESSRNYKQGKEDQEYTLSQKILDEMTAGLATWVKDKTSTSGIHSAKMTAMIDVLKNKIKPGEKTLVFTSFKKVIDVAVLALQTAMPDKKFLILDGDVTGDERDSTLDMFKDHKLGYDVMFISYKVGSEGLNLVEANNIIMFENWWCPSTKQQAKFRSYRIGQKNEVNIWNLIVKNSIEEKIEAICQEKLKLIDDFLISKKKFSTKMDAATLGRVIR